MTKESNAGKCQPNNHQFHALDITQRNLGGAVHPDESLTTPKFSLYCVKCGEVRSI